jgi:uncharacterized SAM-binding protein YcdF (DUF218 family)
MANPKAEGRLRIAKRWWCLGILALLLGLAYLLHPVLLPAVARWLDVSEAPRPADDVLVLGGDAETRPFVAAALYNKKLVKRVLVTKPKRMPAVDDSLYPPEEKVIRGVLEKRGVNPADIMLLDGEEVDSTADEAEVLRHYLEDNPERTVAVVTTCYHTRRARWIFHKKLGPHAGQVYFVGGPTEGYDTSNWWRSEQGFRRYLDEYAKLGFYLANY